MVTFSSKYTNLVTGNFLLIIKLFVSLLYIRQYT